MYDEQRPTKVGDANENTQRLLAHREALKVIIKEMEPLLSPTARTVLLAMCNRGMAERIPGDVRDQMERSAEFDEMRIVCEALIEAEGDSRS